MKVRKTKRGFGKQKASDIVTRKSHPYFNCEGYADPTAYQAIKSVVKEESETEKQVHDLIHVIRSICQLAGFEVVGRIELKHKRSGREFK